MQIPRSIVLSVAIGATVVVLGGGTALAATDGSFDADGTSVDTAGQTFDELRRQQYQAWADEDGSAFAATFTEDADFVTFNGDYMRTRDGIAEGMQYYFDNYIQGNTIHMLDEHVRFVDSSTAIIVRTTCLINDGETDCREDSLSVNTNVMTRRHGEWLQQSFQNTRKVELP